jgi:hypothetical protein
MKDPSCKANARQVVERLGALYARRSGDRIFATMALPPGPTLAAFRRTRREGPCEYPDPAERIRFWGQVLAEQPVVEDDSLPVCYLSEMDQGLYGGVLGGDVRFDCNPATGWISSMVPRLLPDWSGLDRLRFDRAHPWFRRYLEQLRIYRDAAEGRFGICPFVLINGMNFVFELVGGTDAYIAMREEPEIVSRAMELGFEVNAAVMDAFFEAVPLWRGGTFHYGCQWLPGRAVMESVDPFHMTSVDDFEAWGRGPLERVFARYDGGQTHLHGNGRHLMESVVTVKGLKAVILGEDHGYPRGYTILDELRRRSGDMPLTVGIPFPEFERMLAGHTLPGGIFYLVEQAPDADSVNRCMEKVRAYRW